VSLREVTEDDIPAWFARATDAESADLAGDPIPESVEQGYAMLRRHRERFQQQSGIRWAIVPTGASGSVGTIGFTISSRAERAAEIGFVVGRAHWGRGLCTAAAELSLDYGFRELGLAVVRAEVLHRNGASRRVLEKLGFRIERDLPGDPQAGGESEDCYIYVLKRPRAA
jgi:ribosomal-protein-alanine N-acetyltransferase